MFNDYDSFIISFDLQCILKAFCVMLFDLFMPLVWYIYLRNKDRVSVNIAEYSPRSRKVVLKFKSDGIGLVFYISSK